MILEIGWLLVGLLLFMEHYIIVLPFMYLLRWDHYFNPPISPFRKGGIEKGFYAPFNSGFQINNNYFKRCPCHDKIKFVIKKIAIKNKEIKEKITQV